MCAYIGLVKFGIFYEHQMGRPWEDETEHRLIQDALEQVELADRLGIHFVWEVEHHFLEEYSHSSAPEVFLAACSQRTSRIRLGHGVILTAPSFNHPARTAERLSMLDLVSNGRVEFGSGESSSEAELAGFGIDPLVKREQWLEYARPIVDGWSLRQAAKRVGVHLETSFRWRHRFLATTKGAKATAVTGIVEADETFIRKSAKGSKRLSTEEHDCVLIVRDRSGATTDQVLPDLQARTFAAYLAPVVAKDAVLVSDER